MKKTIVLIVAALLVLQVPCEVLASLQSDRELVSWQIQLLVAAPQNSSMKVGTFGTVTPSRFRQLKSAALPEHKAMYSLLYKTALGVPNNVTDAGLHDYAADDASSLKLAISQAFRKRKVTAREYESYSLFAPEIGARLVQATATPWFVSGELPEGAPWTTWASDSLYEIYRAISMAELAHKSVTVRLLRDFGYVTIPSSVDAYYTWSRAPNETITLPPAEWSSKDVGKLRKLLKNPLYAEMAQQKLAELGAN
jgi:hypothetical protein